jgi:menaquinone-specific isochorismate synthase
MNFECLQIPDVDVVQLRSLGARNGWLLEDSSAIRVGFGPTVATVNLPNGLGGSFEATDALREHKLISPEGPRGTGITAFGSLPFDRHRPSELSVPQFVITNLGPNNTWLVHSEGAGACSDYMNEELPLQEVQSARSLAFSPPPEEYAHNVALAVEILRHKELDKVVLARSVSGTVPERIDPAALLQRLKAREPLCTLYSMPVGLESRYVGASPELLVRRFGGHVTCHPLAGTIALPANVAPDDYQNWLLGSSKNLHEHQVPVTEIVTALTDLFDRVVADPQPSIVALRTLAHLGTWIHAYAENEVDSPDALEVLKILHPTAAVCGIPRDDAARTLSRLEQHDRGHYAGPVGWINHRGDGEWFIGIRGILLEENRFEAWAGAGIVSESDPTAEREETRAKLASVLSSVLLDAVQ